MRHLVGEKKDRTAPFSNFLTPLSGKNKISPELIQKWKKYSKIMTQLNSMNHCFGTWTKALKSAGAANLLSFNCVLAFPCCYNPLTFWASELRR